MSRPYNLPVINFQSCLASWFQQFLQEKRALGFKYRSESLRLLQIDRLLIKKGQKTEALPRPIIEAWLKPKPYHASTTLSCNRTLARQLALFLVRHDIPAYVIPFRKGETRRNNHVPYIFSYEEIRKILAVADSLHFCGQSPLYHKIMPEIFRLLYGCGLRVGEATNLQVRDVDLITGVLTIREAKGNNDRLVPIAPSINERLKRYAQGMGNRPSDAPFFPAPDGKFYSPNSIYGVFRQFLWQVGISHGGRGHGPRLHDLRHTMACHRLIKWYREGANLNAKLPVLSAYLGHHDLIGTQRYLHLTAEIFPDITLNLESALGRVIPQRNTI